MSRAEDGLVVNSGKKISIIMGVHNGGKRFVEAVKSIENQTYSHWEFIICDDGSTDDTFERLKEYAKGNPKYKIIQNKQNLGLAATLNHCLDYCTGEYIARMDDDDYSYPERFEKQIEYLEAHSDIDFVSTWVDVYDGEKITKQIQLPEFPTKWNMTWRSCFVHPATMFRAEALRSVGGYRVAEEVRRGQDYDLFMRMYGQGLQGANLTELLFRYTQEGRNRYHRTLKGELRWLKVSYRGYKAMGVLPWAAPLMLKPFVALFLEKASAIAKAKDKRK